MEIERQILDIVKEQLKKDGGANGVEMRSFINCKRKRG